MTEANATLRSSIVRRLQLLSQLRTHPRARPIEIELCRRSVARFFDNWVWTYDPRAAAEGGAAHIPFDLFPRQRDFVQWLDARVSKAEDGLAEKSRDIGFTWMAGGYAIHHWLFVPGFKTTFGSRKGEYVDRIGDPDSIFEKMRMIVRMLPAWMRPPGFNPSLHDNHMLMMNPYNENTIRGEGGDEMGRGGRSSLYFIDEAAFIERAERVEAATSANTDVRIWGSSVNGMGNLFARKRHGGNLRPDQIFRFHWTDDPRKTPEWATKKRESLESHVWASEYDIDYTASTEGICIPAKWVDSAKRIAALLRAAGTPMEPAAEGVAGGDVGAGKARSVLVPRFGPVVGMPTSWGDPDTIETANRLKDAALDARAIRSDGHECRVRALRFDSVGVGHGVGSVLSRSPRGLIITGVNVGIEPTDRSWPDGETSQEKFTNRKAEGWWIMRERFKCTHEMVLFLEKQDGGQLHPISDLISLPPDSAGPDAMMLSGQISLVKWFRNEKGKIQIESKQQLSQRGITSPDHADGLVLTFTGDSGVETWANLFGKRAA